MNSFELIDSLRELFDSRPGSLVSEKLTFVPTGCVVRISGYAPFLRVTGSRIFPADHWDYMMEWTRKYDADYQAALTLLV